MHRTIDLHVESLKFIYQKRLNPFLNFSEQQGIMYVTLMKVLPAKGKLITILFSMWIVSMIDPIGRIKNLVNPFLLRFNWRVESISMNHIGGINLKRNYLIWSLVNRLTH